MFRKKKAPQHEANLFYSQLEGWTITCDRCDFNKEVHYPNGYDSNLYESLSEVAIYWAKYHEWDMKHEEIQ